jgi:hypothetical protein
MRDCIRNFLWNKLKGRYILKDVDLTGRGTYIRALCQKNEGSVEIKHRPIKMGGRTVYRTLSRKRAPFQTGID